MSVVYTATGIQDAKVTELTLYPNPVINILSISSGEELKEVDVYSLTGVLVKRAEGNIKTIDMSRLSKGSYLIKVLTASGSVTQKMIKE